MSDLLWQKPGIAVDAQIQAFLAGDDVILGAAGSCGQAKDRMDGKEDVVCQDWFFCSRKLDKEKVLSTILKK